MKINSISNYNFRANQKQNTDDKNSKLGHKTKLFLGSLISIAGAKLAKDAYFPNEPIKEPDVKTLKEFLTKENLKTVGKTVGTYLGLSLILASVINFIYEEEKADKVIDKLLITSSM